MKKLLFITFISILWCNISKANEIHLVCVNTNNPDFVASLSIYENDKKISFNGGDPDFYYLENGIFKYVLTNANEALRFRHSLNRNTGRLQVNTYEFDDTKLEKIKQKVVDKIIEANKINDMNFLAKAIHDEYKNYKSTFDGYFNCDIAKSKF